MKPWLVVVAATTLLAGCASESFTMRNLPAETPAADNAVAVERAATMAAGQTAASRLAAAVPARTDAPTALTMADAPSMYTYDPWERVNRFTYRFNARFDENVFLPVADAYGHIPLPMRSGVHNFLTNLAEVTTVVNDGLQLQVASGGRSLARFVINSTVGVGGLFDIASRFHLARAPTTFGATLSRWGVRPGPYIVLPLLGPSTLRESVGLLADYGISYAINVVDLYRGDQAYALGAVNALDTRSNSTFRYYATASAFEYETIRFLYVHKALIEDEALHPKRRSSYTDDHAPAAQ